MTERPIALRAASAAPRPAPSGFPADLVAALQGREKRVLGDPFGLTNFGVTLVRLLPGANSSRRHAHARQDEWIDVSEGRPTLILGEREQLLAPGDGAGVPAGTGRRSTR